jgi:hypothetical protein
VHGRFAIRLPQGFSNALSVKLAVLYMEQYLLNPQVRVAPWIVRNDFVTYICLSELFEFIGMSVTARQLEIAIITGMRGHPLEAEQVGKIWAREKKQYPSRYAETMADNIFTFSCPAKVEDFLTEYDMEPTETYEQRIKQVIQQRVNMLEEPAGQVPDMCMLL